MRVEFPKSKQWVDHLYSRKWQAVQVGLIKKSDRLLIEDAFFFVPNSMALEELSRLSPVMPINALVGKKNEDNSGWVKREDLLHEASHWISHEYGCLDSSELLCEAGYSKRDDKILNSRPHILLHNKPFLKIELKGAEIDSIAKLLRWGRSYRLLGTIRKQVVKSSSIDEVSCPSIFICDVFDCDSIIVCKLSV